MTEKQILLKNLERLRSNFGLSRSVINEKLKWGKLKYSRIHNGIQDPTLNDLIEIAGLYGLHVVNLLDSNLEMPNIDSLSTKLKEEAKKRIGSLDKKYEKSNIIPHTILILDKYFKANDTFTISKIKSYLPPDLGDKSIEWRKTSLKDYIEATDKKDKGKTKSEILYRLVKSLPTDMVKNAKKLLEQENNSE